MLACSASQGCWQPRIQSSCVCTGKVKKELDADDGHLNLDETAKLLQDLHEAQAERGGSRPSSNLSSLSNTSPSDRDQHHLGKGALGPSVCLSPQALRIIWEEGSRAAGGRGRRAWYLGAHTGCGSSPQNSAGPAPSAGRPCLRGF